MLQIRLEVLPFGEDLGGDALIHPIPDPSQREGSNLMLQMRLVVLPFGEDLGGDESIIYFIPSPALPIPSPTLPKGKGVI